MNRIKVLRNERGISQKALSLEIGYSQATVSAWESGLKTPSSKAAATIADYFNVSLDYLLGRCDEVEEQPSESIRELRKEIIPLLEGLSDSDLQRVGDFVAGLKAARAGAAAAPDPDRPMQK